MAKIKVVALAFLAVTGFYFANASVADMNTKLTVPVIQRTEIICEEGFVCQCPTRYGSSKQCKVNVHDDCLPKAEPKACEDGGVCVDGFVNGTCTCPPGYTGANCSQDINECDIPKLCGFGICENRIGSYKCNCQRGFGSANCNWEFDDCFSEPCKNNGTCKDSINDYECVCAPGFTGKNCESCLAGFTGSRCEINIDECESSPCQNDGRCIDGINNFTCDCTGTGYEGYLCEVDLGECRRSDPCVRGRCINSPVGYSCICEAEDDCGRHCDRKDPCLVSKAINETLCFNDAVCTARCDDLDPLTSQPTYTCTCTDGYTGHNCSVPLVQELTSNLKLVAIIVPIVAALLLIVGAVITMARKMRATRGTFSPSMFSPDVEMAQSMEPVPEELQI